MFEPASEHDVPGGEIVDPVIAVHSILGRGYTNGS
jgi:hypothetical protein